MFQSRDDITDSAMTILHNCAETDENKEYFYNEPKMVEVIAWYAQNTSQKDNVRALCIYSFCPRFVHLYPSDLKNKLPIF